MPINDAFLELGPCNIYVQDRPLASVSTSLVAATNNDLTFRAQKAHAGTAGNAITVTYVAPGSPNAVLAVSVLGTAITVNLATSGASVVTTTAAQVQAAIKANFTAAGLVYAVNVTGNDGTGLVAAMASLPLAGGTDVYTSRDVGALGEDTQMTIAATASPILAAQSGTQPRDKVITGGSLIINAPLREVGNLRNWEYFPNAVLIEGADGKLKVEIVVRAGESMRKSRGTRLQLRKIIGGVESANPHDHFTAIFASPSEATGAITFSPTEQREIPVTFECWPDANGVLGFWGHDPI